jgi:subtilase family serine protease
MSMRQVAILREAPKWVRGTCFRGWFAIGAILLCLAPAALGQRQFLHGHVPAAATQLQPLGRLDGSKPMEVLIGLPLRNRETLTNLLNDLYNPASPSYHQFLTPSQFTEQFGPTVADYEAVVAFAKSNGLTVLHTHANRTIVEVSGSVADIEKTFHVQMRLYQHPTEPRTFYAPDSEPSIDLATPVLAITGLDNFIIPHPQSLQAKKKKNPIKPLAGTAPGQNYWGNDFRAAYVPGTTLTGSGQAVGLFELDDFYTSDITTYESDTHLPNVPLSRLTVDGYASGHPSYDNVEVALDIEMAVSMAPGLSGVIVYEGPNENNITAPNMVLNCMATNNAAKQLSCSWGFNINFTTVQTFQQFSAQGQSFFLASGDTGAFTGAAAPPADAPYVTVVGETTLTPDANGSW